MTVQPKMTGAEPQSQAGRDLGGESDDGAVPSWLNDCRSASGAIGRARVAVRLPLHPRDALRLVQLRGRISTCAESLAESVERLLAVSIAAFPSS